MPPRDINNIAAAGCNWIPPLPRRNEERAHSRAGYLRRQLQFARRVRREAAAAPLHQAKVFAFLMGRSPSPGRLLSYYKPSSTLTVKETSKVGVQEGGMVEIEWINGGGFVVGTPKVEAEVQVATQVEVCSVHRATQVETDCANATVQVQVEVHSVETQVAMCGTDAQVQTGVLPVVVAVQAARWEAAGKFCASATCIQASVKIQAVFRAWQSRAKKCHRVRAAIEREAAAREVSKQAAVEEWFWNAAQDAGGDPNTIMGILEAGYRPAFSRCGREIAHGWDYCLCERWHSLGDVVYVDRDAHPYPTGSPSFWMDHYNPEAIQAAKEIDMMLKQGSLPYSATQIWDFRWKFRNGISLEMAAWLKNIPASMKGGGSVTNSVL